VVCVACSFVAAAVADDAAEVVAAAGVVAVGTCGCGSDNIDETLWSHCRADTTH